MRQGILSCLIGAGFLILTACAGGEGESGSSGSGGGNGEGGVPSSLEVDFTFAPIANGFVISNQSDFLEFGNFTSLNITATSGDELVWEVVPITAFSDGNHSFTGLDDALDWKFEITGILSDGGEQEVKIVFVWEENEADHRSGGIRPGANRDGDRRADSVDDDIDGDGVANEEDDCSTGETNWESNGNTDNDGDGCRDRDEDEDDDNDNVLDLMDTGTVGGRDCRLHEDCDDDGVNDGSDQCRTSVISWTSDSSNDNDGDGCRDTDEDPDDDNDGLGDDDLIEQLINSNNVRCSLLVDCDGDNVRDMDEVAAACVIKADCDNDGTQDDADIDDDGDGLIEIANEMELDSVRYALNGNGRRLLAGATLNTDGCGGTSGIKVCNGYELVRDISLVAYANVDGGKGWQPLGHDTGSADGCQGNAFEGTFEGNGFMISELNISRSSEDCVGLFGHIAADSAIRNLRLRAERVVGDDFVGSLVGWGNSASIVNSSVVAGEVNGTGSNVGGLVGRGHDARINTSSIEAAKVSGNDNVGGLVGDGRDAQIIASSIEAAEVSGNNRIGGLVGDGQNARVNASSVVAAKVSGNDNVGGLVGDGRDARINASSVMAGSLSGNDNVGGLVGDGRDAQIIASSIEAAEVSGNNRIGGLVGDGQNARINASSVVVDGVRGNDNVGGLMGNGDGALISSFSAVVGNVSGDTNIGGLVGRGQSAAIVNSFVVVDGVRGTGNNIGGLVGSGLYSRIVSSSVVVTEISGDRAVGGLVGFLDHGARADPAIVARIVSSSVAAAEVRGNSLVGGLGGDTTNIRVHFSSVVVGEVRGTGDLIGGMVGGGPGTKVFSSSVVAGLISAGQDGRGNSKLGGMMGGGPEAEIYSSSVLVGELRGTGRNIGGLVGNANKAKFYSSSVVVGNLSGSGVNLGGLVGEFAGSNPGAKVAYSYVVSGSDTDMLVGASNEETAAVASYWDSDTSGVSSSQLGIGSGKSTRALQMPTSYDEGGIYADWANHTNIFGDGMTDEPLAVWCDKDNSGSIEEGEGTDDNLIWDFGTSSQYPAIRCTPMAPGEWRSWWSLDESDSPALNRTRLDRLFTFVEDGDGDNDGVDDNSDRCPFGATGWLSDAVTDNDGDGCRDTVEDTDDDNDGVNDNSDQCPAGVTGWTSESFNDADGDGCRDADEDTDVDGDGLIEIATAAQLDAVRHQLDGSGPGCGSCNGYELVANISLAAYADADSGKGWQPLGSCGDSPFAGTFEGNDFMISDLSINRPSEDCVGLFGHIAVDSAIRNLRFRAERVVGDDFVGSLVGNGDGAMISSFSAVVGNVSGDTNIGGLVGRGHSAAIVNSFVVVDGVRGTGNNIGGLVGDGLYSRIVSSSVVVAAVSGDRAVGGLVGFLDHGARADPAIVARIVSSSVAAAEVRGRSLVGGLGGDTTNIRVHFSSVVVGEVRGTGDLIGGMVGGGPGTKVFSSSVVAGLISAGQDGRGNSKLGGMMGGGPEAEVFSSTVMVGELRGTGRNIGGLVGNANKAKFYSSSVVVGNLSGSGMNLGGLVGEFAGTSPNAKVAYSYVVSGSDTDMLVGASNEETAAVASYWDNDTSGVGRSRLGIGSGRSTRALQMPTSYDEGGIYADWDNHTNIFGDGEAEPLAVWCDKDNSGSIEEGEDTDDNLIWDFGDSDEYPAIRCTPMAPGEWRSWWSLDEKWQPCSKPSPFRQVI